MFSVDVGFLISQIPVGTVAEVNRTNALVRQMKKWKNQEYTMHSFKEDSVLHAIHWRSSKIFKISRVCRSPAAAETQASVDGEDDLL